MTTPGLTKPPSLLVTDSFARRSCLTNPYETGTSRNELMPVVSRSKPTNSVTHILGLSLRSGYLVNFTCRSHCLARLLIDAKQNHVRYMTAVELTAYFKRRDRDLVGRYDD